METGWSQGQKATASPGTVSKQPFAAGSVPIIPGQLEIFTTASMCPKCSDPQRVDSHVGAGAEAPSWQPGPVEGALGCSVIGDSWTQEANSGAKVEAPCVL